MADALGLSAYHVKSRDLASAVDAGVLGLMQHYHEETGAIQGVSYGRRDMVYAAGIPYSLRSGGIFDATPPIFFRTEEFTDPGKFHFIDRAIIFFLNQRKFDVCRIDMGVMVRGQWRTGAALGGRYYYGSQADKGFEGERCAYSCFFYSGKIAGSFGRYRNKLYFCRIVAAAWSVFPYGNVVGAGRSGWHRKAHTLAFPGLCYDENRRYLRRNIQ